MDLEHLNRTQIVLLTLLVSFVTSIATGIVTVSLMNQVPPQVAATVNHVIEHTIEKVEPAQTKEPAAVVKTIVEEGDLAPSAIAKVQKSIIRIVAPLATDTVIARGILVDSHGGAITDSGSVQKGGAYEAIFEDGSAFPLTVASSSASSSITTLRLSLSSTSPYLTPATFAKSSQVALGESVIAVGGAYTDTVEKGIISALPENDAKDGGSTLAASVSSEMPGSVLIDLSGAVVGMVTSRSEAQGAFVWSVPKLFTQLGDASSTDASQ